LAYIIRATTLSLDASQALQNLSPALGNFCQPLQSTFIRIDKPSKRSANAVASEFNFFTEARLTVIQALLMQRTSLHTGMDLTSITGASTATASKPMTQLELLA
jgi:hypothetical protein